MDLKEYFFNNISEKDYHYRFIDAVKDADIFINIFNNQIEEIDREYYIFDDDEAISKFRELCQPENKLDEVTISWFYLLTYYLYKAGYVIKEHPDLLAKPPINPDDFIYKEIRKRLIALGRDEKGIVKWEERRKYVSELSFIYKGSVIEINESISRKLIEISNRNASFERMSTDEKLSEIVNLIENLLFKNNEYISLEYNQICFEYLSNEMIKNYRKRLQCFRHAKESSLQERNSYTEEQKLFLVDYGLLIISVINKLLELKS